MNISRDVITDLLPLYLAGEASPGTRALLEQYLRENPDVAAKIREHADRSTALLAAAVAPPMPDHEKATLERVRRFNRARQILLALAVAFTLLPFSFMFAEWVRWVMLRDSPVQAAILAVAALVCWIAYSVMGRRLRIAA